MSPHVIIKSKMGQTSTNTTLEALRSALNDDQRKLLNSFWKNYLDTTFWPLRMDIHQKYTKEKTIEILRSVGGKPDFAGHIVCEDHAQNGPIYILSPIGILLTKNGKQYEQWLVRLLEFFRKRFYQKKDAGGTVEYDNIQIRDALKISEEKLQVLGELTRFTQIIHSYGHTAGGNWKIGRPYNIDDFPIKGSLQAYFENELLKSIGHEKWVYQSDPDKRFKQPRTAVVIGNELSTPFQEMPVNTASQKLETVKIFISHSSRDKKLLEALTDLLRTAFVLHHKDIVCTSVAGHKLPGGADTEEALLERLNDAKLLIGVLTPTSLRSSYVLFELGARWGMKQPLISLVASGTTMNDLQEPLKSKNALKATEEHDVQQMIEDVSKYLGQESEPPSVYSAKMRRFISAARKVVAIKSAG